MLTSLQRVIRFGWNKFSGNAGLNLGIVFILVILCTTVISLFLLEKSTHYLISVLREKVDVTVYFQPQIEEQEILEIKEKIVRLPDVKSVRLVPKQEALEKFTKRHRDNPVIIESLEEIGINPFYPSLHIKAFGESQYAGIANFLNQDSFKDLITRVDYQQKKPVIEKLFSVTSQIKKGGFILSIVLGILAFLITFNTMRLAIFHSQEEIEIMRLMGASNWFIRSPFLVQGIICGMFAVGITVLIFIPLILFLGPKLVWFAAGLDLSKYFFNNFLTLILLSITASIGITVFSSLIAIRKYLKV